MIARSILKKVDKNIEEVYENPTAKHAGVKAFVSGAMEGMVDGAVIMYPILVASCCYWRKKALKK